MTIISDIVIKVSVNMTTFNDVDLISNWYNACIRKICHVDLSIRWYTEISRIGCECSAVTIEAKHTHWSSKNMFCHTIVVHFSAPVATVQSYYTTTDGTMPSNYLIRYYICSRCYCTTIFHVFTHNRTACVEIVCRVDEQNAPEYCCPMCHNEVPALWWWSWLSLQKGPIKSFTKAFRHRRYYIVGSLNQPLGPIHGHAMTHRSPEFTVR